jgi:sulfite reductase alpha subunit
MAKKPHDTPMLDELESGPWPSFVTGLKRLAQDKDYMVDLMGHAGNQLPHQEGLLEGRHRRRVRLRRRRDPALHRAEGREGRAGFPRRRRVPHPARAAAAGHALHTDVLRKMCDIWEEHGSGLIAFHGQSGDIMFQGAKTDKVQAPSTSSTNWASTSAVPAPRCAPA